MEEKKNTKLADFGKKIGGARKDQWKDRGMSLEDLLNMTDQETRKYVTKDNVWPKPDWASLLLEGNVEKAVRYWQNEIRKSLPAYAGSLSGQDKETRYVRVVSELRDLVMNVRTEEEAKNFYREKIVSNGYVIPMAGRYVDVPEGMKGIISNKFLHAVSFPGELYYKQRKKDYVAFGVPKERKEYEICKNKLTTCLYDKKHAFFETFGRDGKMRLTVKYGSSSVYFYPEQAEAYSKTWEPDTWFVVNTETRHIEAYGLPDEASAMEKVNELAKVACESGTGEPEKKKAASRNQKAVFKMAELSHFTRTGEEILKPDENVSPERFLATFPVHGGEFGNWLSGNDRQQHLNLAYEALSDLAKVLDFSPSDVVFGGKLSIAFGSRGRGGQSAASAHFEPVLEVINLTKMHGAGCLAHEWGHAFDHFLAVQLNDEEAFASGTHKSGLYPSVFCDLINAMIRNEDRTITDFYTASCKFDKVYRKSGHGYWSSQCEMFARAFDCYVADRLAKRGWRNDYLTSNADSFMLVADDGTTYRAYPCGKERERLNRLFDKLFEKMRAK